MTLRKTGMFFLLLTAICANAVELTADPALTGAAPLPAMMASPGSQNGAEGFDNTPAPMAPAPLSRMFGAQLFSAPGADSGAGIGFNPNYIIGLGDTVQVRLWGAFVYDGTLTVDPKGNIFLPNVGPLKVAGITNGQLNTLVTKRVKEVYQANVNVYASLLPGQVEDDASLQTGAPGLATNQALLRAVRQARPDAFIVYKPHPDVAYGRRPGFISKQDALRWADTVTQSAHIIDCICHADEIHTMTSLCGFEGLMHEKKVFCYGLPFYAGWGLTTDTLRCDRRTRNLTLDELVYQTLIAYPTYIHPVSKKIISAEEAVEYLIYRSAAMRPARTPFARYYRLLVELLALLPSKPQ